MKTIKVTFWGGYHNVPEINMNISLEAYEALYYVIEGDETLVDWACANLSEYQTKRLDKHFCGIKGCSCGSFEHANFTAI